MTIGRATGAAGLVFATLLVVSCSTTPPKILQTFWQVDLVRNPSSGVTHERLSLFVQLGESGTLSDLSSIYLMNDASELYWRLGPSNWQTSKREGELWVGSNEIQTPDGAPLPRGKYRILVTNVAGERARGDIFVSSDELNPKGAPFPSLTISGTHIRIHATLPETSLWLYNDAGHLLGAHRGSGGEVELGSLLPHGRPPQSAIHLYAYSYDQSCGCGLMEGPYSIAAP